MPNLQKLPYHRGLEHRTDPARCYDKRVGSEYKVVQARKEGPVFEGQFDKWVGILLERQLDPNAHRIACDPRHFRTLVRCLHQTRAAAGDNIAAHFRKGPCYALCLLVSKRSGFRPRRSEDCDAISLPPRRPKPREVIDNVPKPQ